MNIVGVLSGKRKCLLAIAIAFSTFGNAQLVTYPEGLNTGSHIMMIIQSKYVKQAVNGKMYSNMKSK